MAKRDLSDEWIGNIKKLDAKNNLKHGEIYAGDGSIHDFEIENSTVKAKVDGAPGDVFDVEIKFNPLTSADKNSIRNFIEKNYSLYIQLLNNQIPQVLLNSKFKILPYSLKDFKMSCSCSRGLFCKHKAAVFHKLKNEIKKDHFLIFTLRDFNLKDEIQNENRIIKTIREVVKNDSPFTLEDKHTASYLTWLNFMLDDYPSFYSSDTINFNDLVFDVLKSMSSSINRIQNPINKNEFHEYIILGNTLRSFEYFSSKSPEQIQKAFENKWLNPQKWESFKIDIDGNYEITSLFTGRHTNNFTNSNLKHTLFAFFAELNQVDIDDYCGNIKFLQELYLFTAKLIYVSGLIPEFFALDNGKYHIRWIPTFEKSIFLKLNEFFDKCPERLLTFYEGDLSKRNQVISLISLFFEGFSSYYLKKLMPANIAQYSDERYFRLFFAGSQDFSYYKYRGKEFEVNNWVSTLYFSQKDFKFIITSLQNDFNFFLNLKVQTNSKTFSIPELFKNNKTDIIENMIILDNAFSKFDFEYDFNHPRGMDLHEFIFFIDEIAPNLKEMGIEVEVPREFGEVQNLKLIIDSKVKKTDASLSIDDLIDFDWKIAIGDERFSLDEFKTFSQNFRGLVKIKDKYYVVDEKELKQLSRDVSSIPKNRDKMSMLRYILSRKDNIVEITEKLERLLDNTLEITSIHVPDSLKGNLRPYQEIGFSWMLQNIRMGFGSILADDMGLGKTIQLLSVVLHLKENDLITDKKVLIVTPTSLISNWIKEIEKFAPSLKTRIYHGQKRQFPDEDYDILLTSYGIVRQDIDEFKSQNWFLIAIDEAQNIKNPKSKQTSAIKSVNANHHIALSGTPVENHLSEYWSIFDFINKGYLFNLKQFNNNFIKPIQNNQDEKILEDFKKITSPFILRRLKTDKEIIKELPDKIINDVYCNLTVKQATMYEETLNQLFEGVEQSEGIERKGKVLKLINSLKQICNHPSQFLKLNEAKVEESGKMEVMMNILENILDADEKVLIFTQYVQMGKIMKRMIEDKFDEEVLFLYGGLKRDEKDNMIDKFQMGKNKIFILSLKAGGIGINLTAASNVIHYDLWWNPAVENQATDRAYRIGQSDDVMVYRFITTGTLEEKINQILLRKRELVEMTIEGNESFITEMNNNELQEMLKLRENILE